MIRATLMLSALTAACCQAQVAERPTILAESFETDSPGWKLVLNRGAEAELAPCDEGVLGARSVQVTPRLLCAPDDREGSTNIHVRYEEIELRAGVRYVMSAWMRSSGDRLVRLRVRRNSVEESVSGGRMALGPQWRRCEFAFTLPIDYPDGVPQILLGESLLPVWIDAVTIAEAPAEDLAPADYVTFADDVAVAKASLVRFATDFDDEANTWQLRLNRGAQAQMALEDGCLRIAPSALCAPTNQAYATNVHIHAPAVSLRAGQEYVFSVRLRSDGPRVASLRLRGADGGGALSGPEFEVREQWQRYEWRFTPEQDLPAVVPQVLAGYDLRPLWVDDVVLAEAGVGDEPPEGCIARGGLWLRPEVQVSPFEASGSLAGLVALAADLPASVRMHLAVDMFGAPDLRLVLGDEGPSLAVTIAGDAIIVGEERHAIAPEGWRAGEALTLTVERLDGRRGAPCDRPRGLARRRGADLDRRTPRRPREPHHRRDAAGGAAGRRLHACMAGHDRAGPGRARTRRAGIRDAARTARRRRDRTGGVPRPGDRPAHRPAHTLALQRQARLLRHLAVEP